MFRSTRLTGAVVRLRRWKDYLVGEKTYMFLSLFAKTLLAWQVFAGTLRP